MTSRAIQYDAERAALTLKFAFSTLGAGLEP
jgi:hypothetical protein